ncbi:type III pantothenate kinase [Gelidibacter salicanalis]|uniref:Type III pantothenate kinase n=1 Tax=Gelidibacter salicanalis TaxID=291193 RepID=A0A934KRL3_9FLAO|nr:type III pantothenate kinase [Gelidibacter salicanalis]MBJ7880790.1 type III pantothenate kinase [Gelidibacter salicanalis]
MNLIVDVGNTLVKFAVFQEDKLLEKQSVEISQFEELLKNIFDNYPKIRKSILSSVGNLPKEALLNLEKRCEVLVLNADLKFPFQNCYATPHTLGVDRMALVTASIKHYSHQNVLIIDAGSCITYDFVTKDNDYLGGAISPGIRLRYKSLHQLTANLPLLDTEVPKTIVGDTTAGAIHSGVVIGIIKEIDGVIDEYREKYPDLTVILTGGDSIFLSKQLKNSIFANSNFLLEGLNFILEYNTH